MVQQAAETLLENHPHERVVRIRAQVIRIGDLVPVRFHIMSVRIIVTVMHTMQCINCSVRQ